MARLDYSDTDVQEILKRAAAIDGNANLNRHVLEQTAVEMGISREALERAEAEYTEARAKEARREAFIRARRRGAFDEIGSNLGIMALLVGIWWITKSSHPWFIYPVAGITIGVLPKIVRAFTTRGDRFERDLEQWDGSELSRSGRSGSRHDEDEHGAIAPRSRG